ncbi:hypothetical protein Tsubulata_044565 [Turnera subulata]|uniref:CCHC-type domain-containing protein n=1 Tax=Turnera subulata TaxID=218843 RepID=A0A9Q0GG46_9ROSI|nr:hypothetical protein Tsubulata_044565 [Turnera subulata]
MAAARWLTAAVKEEKKMGCMNVVPPSGGGALHPPDKASDHQPDNPMQPTEDSQEGDVTSVMTERGPRLWGLRGSFRVIDLDHNYFLVRLADGSDYLRALTGGPWVILDHYLTVEPWKPNFFPTSHKVKTVVAWIRVPGLSSELYQLAILKENGNRIGRFIRVDYSTQKTERGRFAKAAVELDLSAPLQTETCVDGVWYSIMYEHIPLVCFECGRAGHAMASCPSKLQTAPDLSKQPTATSAMDTEIPPQAGVPRASASNVETVEAGATPKPKYREWILVPPKVKMSICWGRRLLLRLPVARPYSKGVAAGQAVSNVSVGGSIGGCSGEYRRCHIKELTATALDTSRRISKAKKGKTKVGAAESQLAVLDGILATAVPVPVAFQAKIPLPSAPPQLTGGASSLPSSSMAVAFDLRGQGHDDIATLTVPRTTKDISSAGEPDSVVVVDSDNSNVQEDQEMCYSVMQSDA